MAGAGHPERLGIKADEVNLFVDLTYNMIKGAGPARSRAGNVNTIDEVPDSSWSTNRAGVRSLTPADITKGPNTTDGPAAGPGHRLVERRRDAGFTVTDTAGRKVVPEVRSARLPRHDHRPRSR